ncbi:hypothetical protein F3Y22_tig00008262pilonHSYRG00055 [Hibiscus syriacus]|uniref:Retrovirus-related Pol polyprotein from transposon TNT 1-94-like beta-barrel domain-containing protein n=1 Tax=Hibiscus syriacus TaxID=106335 RepID=A0A6A3CE29_HIBSY|nr:hypothetical protein F3Y22_tig00008262pilonHSYRG00055 [Hibiscus syriacus]
MKHGKSLPTLMLSHRGHIKQLKYHLKNITKGSQSITDYMQSIKMQADELATIAHLTNVRSTPWSLPIRLFGSLVSYPYPLKISQEVLPATLETIVLMFVHSLVASNGVVLKYQPPSPRQAQANVATTHPSNTTWLLDSGASHHVTTDHNNLALHNPYDGTNEIMIGDGSGLPISHTSSTSLTTPSYSFSLSNVLCVPTMKRNIISISQFCKSNNTSIEFLAFSFHVKDLRMRKILLQGQTKDGVYEWPLSTTQSPLIAFSSVKTTLPEWHCRLVATTPSLNVCSSPTDVCSYRRSQPQYSAQNNATRVTPTPEPANHSSETECDLTSDQPPSSPHNDPNAPLDPSVSPLVLSLELRKAIYGLKQAPRSCASLSMTLAPVTYFLGVEVTSNNNVNKLSQFMHQSTSDHWNAVKRLLRNKDDFTSTSAYIVYLGHNPISWSSKKQRTVARSFTEAEYRSVASTTAEIRWICSLLMELGVTLPQQPVIYCDNVGATNLCSNPVFHSRMKHVALDYHFIREQVQNGLLQVSHISTADQLADALTKPLARHQFDSLKVKIGLASQSSISRGHDKDIQSN